ncbi:alpha-1,3-rhamnosyl/mannosyltransferase [Azomonas agilis]|uniref:Alpha-1,3-rhamnosyl/mannosyltransferase n=1 Tax=Azomonas agilis TaxID=116849 RepID=A0A562J316_9GAMM|nr:glycosyltransferase family 1 protein [Azomonas agilis]TWH77513.1 alpha-1,3-rhamnosyl/mannosyltransferase [Azomonas agilis]
MNILLGTESLKPPLTGIGNYTQFLLKNIGQSDQVSSVKCFSGFEFLSGQTALEQCQTQSQRMIKGGTGFKKNLRELLRKTTLAYQVRAQIQNHYFGKGAEEHKGFVYHEPNFILKPYAGPCVATIHDLALVRYPEYHPAGIRWLAKQLPNTLARADALITPSEVIRQELIADYGVAPDRVHSIHLGVEPEFQPRTAQQTQSVLQNYALEHGRYVLFLASLEPRKGIDTLLDAWCLVPESIRCHWPLVLAGASGWNNQHLCQRIQAMQHTHGIRHIHFVPQADLPYLYAGAQLFVYPSIYEGFGLPVLEAMSSSVPVISTARTSMAEFARDSIALVESGQPEELGACIQLLLEDSEQRQHYALAGLARAQRFSWQHCAQQTIEVYRQLLP